MPCGWEKATPPALVADKSSEIMWRTKEMFPLASLSCSNRISAIQSASVRPSYTGSVGIGATAPIWGTLARRYLDGINLGGSGSELPPPGGVRGEEVRPGGGQGRSQARRQRPVS